MTADKADDPAATVSAFRSAVNMTPKALEDWLQTQSSRRVGFKSEGSRESVGHRSGRRIIALIGKKPDDYDDSDLQHARKVIGYIHRHLAQRPDGDISETPWRYSLMNWGHDPLRR